MGNKVIKPYTSRPPFSTQKLNDFRKAPLTSRPDLDSAEAIFKQKIYLSAMQKIQEKIIPEVETRTWLEAEKWSNFINSLTLLTALEEVFGFTSVDQGKVIETANIITREINDKKRDMYEMIHHMEENNMIFPDDYKELVRKYGPQ